MPLVEINIAKGENKEFLLSLMNETMNSIQQTLQLPTGDRNIRLLEFENEFFQMKAPYKILIQINMFSGRTIETKKALYKDLVLRLNNALKVSSKEVFIFINEQPLGNWGIRGGIAASDVQLGFKVEV